MKKKKKENADRTGAKRNFFRVGENATETQSTCLRFGRGIRLVLKGTVA